VCFFIIFGGIAALFFFTIIFFFYFYYYLYFSISLELLPLELPQSEFPIGVISRVVISNFFLKPFILVLLLCFFFNIISCWIIFKVGSFSNRSIFLFGMYIIKLTHLYYKFN